MTVHGTIVPIRYDRPKGPLGQHAATGPPVSLSSLRPQEDIVYVRTFQSENNIYFSLRYKSKQC